MAKKRIRKKNISKGLRPNVNRDMVKAVSRGVSEITKALNKLDAWSKGKNPWISVSDGKKGYIRKRANDYYGHWKNARANLFKNDNPNGATL
jgi:hypothetical protein